ncbi:hypothetical protein T492DRAFT_523496 [Pavlovales sp. CCMP2436]|nr:hypothetical protein T492DRAFT_523496 [Pavlovales sp. CCMP2436]
MFNSRTSSSSSISTMASQPPSPVAGKSNGQAASVRGAYSCYAGARTGAVPSQTSSQTGAELTLTSYGASAAAGCISVDLGAAAASNEVSKEGAEQLGARMESLRLSPCLDRSGGRGQLNGQGWHSGQGDGLSPEKFAEALTRQNRGEWDQQVQGLGLDARMASFENAPKDEDGEFLIFCFKSYFATYF